MHTIFVKYALDFSEIGVYNVDKYEKTKLFFEESNLKEDKYQWQEK